MARGGSNRRTGISIKPLLAIISAFLKRAFQNISPITALSAGSNSTKAPSIFAHFVVAILRPILNSQS